MFAQTTNVTQNFDSDPEWDGTGNTGNITPNNTDFGYRNIEGVTGIPEGDYGCIGGVFCRTMAFSYYADTDLNGTLDRTMKFRLAGSFLLAAGSFDSNFYLGYFDAVNPNSKNFVGICFVEPTGDGTPFRGYAGVNGTSGEVTGIIDLSQGIILTFDLTWKGTAEGSGTFIGTLAGQNINVSVGAGTGTFNAFGLLCGGTDSEGNRSTRNCYFDNLTYTKFGDGTTAIVQKYIDLVGIYPNPTTDWIYFRNVPEGSRIVLVDLTGRTILEKNASEPDGGMSLQPFTSGLYVIRLVHGQQCVKSVKIFRN